MAGKYDPDGRETRPSAIIKKEFPMIRKSLWKEMFWSQSFCLLTTGEAAVDIIRQYIQSQGKKDGKQGN